MLTRLHIRNYTLIDHLELEFGPGFSALTGETGAGKSILIDALGLLLGDRARSDLIRAGTSRAELSAEFDLSDLPAAAAWLAEEGLDDGDACVLRRVLQRDGGSRLTINGRPVTAQSLRDLGPLLLEIHGQHAHQVLLQNDAQRELLDRIGGHGALVDEVSRAHEALKRATDALAALTQIAGHLTGHGEWLRSQIEELRELSPQAAEWAALVAEHKRHAHGERLLALTRATLERLAGEESVSAIALLQQAQRNLNEARRLDAALDDIALLVDQTLIPAQEAERALTHYLANAEIDPERLAWLDERLGRYHQLARKHHCAPEELHEVRDRLEAELITHKNRENLQAQLEKEAAERRAAYDRAADRLGAARRQTAQLLAPQIEAQVRPLGLPHACIAIAVETLPNRISPQGRERVDITISMNPGQPPKPVARIASGGELSRIALAIAVVAANHAATGTMIFDEVDAGVGGAVAALIGERLAQLAQHRQVLCVTHQAQVAAHARQHYQVSKAVVDQDTHTRVRALNEAETEEELARMLGGRIITERTREHARELRAHATQSRALSS
ncbi:MAG TPA: DNA repair protein RecN [Candidatus Acidoferrales bacterium]|nr:DNA repair protein RecN [Candidatus Acidoferrales bacterium]